MSTRELPNDQQRIDDEDRKDESQLQTMQRAEELSSQFEDIKDRTVDDNVVLGQLKDINTSETNSTIVVEIDLPGEGVSKDKRFDKPKVWSEDYKFVRWIHHYDYDADSFPNMIEDQCRVKVLRGGNKEYEVFVPEQEHGIVEGINEYASTGVDELTWETVGRALAANVGIGAVAWTLYTIALFTKLVDSGTGPIPTLGMVVIGYLILAVALFIADEIIGDEND